MRLRTAAVEAGGGEPETLRLAAAAAGETLRLAAAAAGEMMLA
jgi:hypothetical protein